MVQLDVDSEVNHVVGPLNPKATDHREPVFIGGVPGKFLAPLWYTVLTFQRVFQRHQKDIAFILRKNKTSHVNNLVKFKGSRADQKCSASKFLN